MKIILKRTISVLLTCVMLLCGICFSSAAEESEEEFYFDVKGDYAVLISCSADAEGNIVVPATVIIDGNEYQVKFIADRAFEDCDDVVTVEFPEGVTSVGSHAFYDCDSLEEVYFPSTLVICQYDAFDECAKVVLHCYSSTYQLSTVCGLSDNVIVDVLDAVYYPKAMDDGEEADKSGVTVRDFVEFLRTLWYEILDLFGIEISK